MFDQNYFDRSNFYDVMEQFSILTPDFNYGSL
jgi:hypothetical protein